MKAFHLLLLASMSGCMMSQPTPMWAGQTPAQQPGPAQSEAAPPPAQPAPPEQIAAPMPAAPPPAAPMPAPMPTPTSQRHPRCAPQDSDTLCAALALTLDVGNLLSSDNGANATCANAAAHLNAWTRKNKAGLDNMATLSSHPKAELDAFQNRHNADFTATFGAAMELDNRCQGDRNIDDALTKAGFNGLIGSSAL